MASRRWPQSKVVQHFTTRRPDIAPHQCSRWSLTSWTWTRPCWRASRDETSDAKREVLAKIGRAGIENFIGNRQKGVPKQPHTNYRYLDHLRPQLDIVPETPRIISFILFLGHIGAHLRDCRVFSGCEVTTKDSAQGHSHHPIIAISILSAHVQKLVHRYTLRQDCLTI